ncbi:hypothetical protein [Clavibacter sp. MX14-G9D]|uniref:hypothetical protein n=1 Tax=Clavibacter sp. MX14-G9D TaxID=3064656 RepID=UPI00293F35BD|nr:hypothetical protein [Clavibacter sp. MX14-G9D]
MAYPHWSYFPRNVRPPEWARELVEVVAAHRPVIDSQPVPVEKSVRLTSDYVLEKLREAMEALGYQVESGKAASQKITRPVLFGEEGKAAVSYDIDAFHDNLGIAVEVEAGRGSNSNADYRDILRTSLLLDARFLVLFMPIAYHFTSAGRAQSISGYANTLNQLSAIYASQRLRLPFEGVLLIGY